MTRRLDASSPIRVPLTVLFSHRDGVVAWQACIDRATPGAEHVEVSSTHIGMGVDPDVWAVVADRLAPPPRVVASGDRHELPTGVLTHQRGPEHGGYVRSMCSTRVPGSRLTSARPVRLRAHGGSQTVRQPPHAPGPSGSSL